MIYSNSWRNYCTYLKYIEMCEIKQFTFPKKCIKAWLSWKKHVAIPCGLEVSKCSTKQTVLILVIIDLCCLWVWGRKSRKSRNQSTHSSLSLCNAKQAIFKRIRKINSSLFENSVPAASFSIIVHANRCTKTFKLQPYENGPTWKTTIWDARTSNPAWYEQTRKCGIFSQYSNPNMELWQDCPCSGYAGLCRQYWGPDVTSSSILPNGGNEKRSYSFRGK